MSATLIGNNVTIKISAAISATGSATSGSTILYTVPANSYAVVSLSVTSSSGSTGSFSIDNNTFVTFNLGVTGLIATSVYAGPGQVIRVVASGAANSGFVTGVLFANSP